MKEKKITMKEGARIAFPQMSESMSVFGLICLCMTSSGSRHLVKHFWCCNSSKDRIKEFINHTGTYLYKKSSNESKKNINK